MRSTLFWLAAALISVSGQVYAACTITITPGDGVFALSGQTATLSASGVDSGTGGPINPATMVWYMDGAMWGKTGSPITATPGEWGGMGWHTIRVEGTDQLGAVCASTSRVYYGVALPAITSPASGITFRTGTSVTFTGTPGASVAPSPVVTPEWWLDRGTAHAVLMGTGGNISYAVPYGSHTVSYAITDSFGNSSASTITLTMDNPPELIITPGDGVFALSGQTATLSASGVDSGTGGPINPATMVWYMDGAMWGKTGSPITATPGEWGGVGWHTIRVEGTDQLGTVGSVTGRVYYGVALPAITSPANGTIFNAGTSVTFTGTPGASVAPSPVVTPEWWLDRGTAHAVLMGTGGSISYAEPYGSHTVSYVIADSFGNRAVSAITIEVPTATVSLTIVGEGSVNGRNQTGVSYGCSGGVCFPMSFSPGDSVTLAATDSVDYHFKEWGGDCPVTSGDCALTLTANKIVTATFEYVKPFRLFLPESSASDFNSFTDAYAVVDDDTTAILYGRQTINAVTDEFTMNRPVTLTFRGGYDAAFGNSSSGWTTLQGSLTIGKGMLTVEKLAIR